jgi:hypothetical protein
MNTTDLIVIRHSLIQYGKFTTIITIIFGILMYLFLNILSRKGAFNPVKEYMIMERKENFIMIFYPLVSAIIVLWLLIGFTYWYLWGGL